MNRRRLIQSAAALAAGLILPPTLAEDVEAVERRYWSLDQTMLAAKPGPWQFVFRGPEHLGFAGYQAATWRERPDLHLATWEGHAFVRREMYETPLISMAEIHAAGKTPEAFLVDILRLEMAWNEGRWS